MFMQAHDGLGQLRSSALVPNALDLFVHWVQRWKKLITGRCLLGCFSECFAAPFRGHIEMSGVWDYMLAQSVCFRWWTTFVVDGSIDLQQSLHFINLFCMSNLTADVLLPRFVTTVLYAYYCYGWWALAFFAVTWGFHRRSAHPFCLSDFWYQNNSVWFVSQCFPLRGRLPIPKGLPYDCLEIALFI